jgi:hypothetical protein
MPPATLCRTMRVVKLLPSVLLTLVSVGLCSGLSCGSEAPLVGTPFGDGSTAVDSGVALENDGAPTIDGATPDAGAPVTYVNILYVHGVKSCDVDRVNAHFSLKTLDDEVLAEVSTRIAEYQKALQRRPRTGRATRKILSIWTTGTWNRQDAAQRRKVIRAPQRMNGAIALPKRSKPSFQRTQKTSS